MMMILSPFEEAEVNEVSWRVAKIPMSLETLYLVVAGVYKH